MKKILKIVSLMSLLFVFVLLTGCSNNSKYAGKYNLVSVSGIPGVTADSYEYNYIELKSNGTYEIKNKIMGTVTEQTGKFEVKGEVITFITGSGSTKVTEEHKLEGNKLTITLSSIVLVFEKE